MRLLDAATLGGNGWSPLARADRARVARRRLCCRLLRRERPRGESRTDRKLGAGRAERGAARSRHRVLGCPGRHRSAAPWRRGSASTRRAHRARRAEARCRWRRTFGPFACRCFAVAFGDTHRLSSVAERVATRPAVHPPARLSNRTAFGLSDRVSARDTEPVAVAAPERSDSAALAWTSTTAGPSWRPEDWIPGV